MLNDNFNMKGELDVMVYGADGALKEKHHFENLVVATGKAFIADRLISPDTAVMSHMAIGTNTVTPVSTDTTLNSELARVALTSAVRTNNVVKYTATFLPSVGTGAITEAAIFNSDVGGIMLSRTVFAVVNKGELDTITIEWTITAQ